MQQSLLAVEIEDGATVVVQNDLGTETTTTGVDGDGAPTQTVTGAINGDPTIMIDRDVTTEQTFELPTQPADEAEEVPVAEPV